MKCPLCHSLSSELYHRDKTRTFELCLDCHLVFVPREQLLPPLAEKVRYDAHQNQEDSGYTDYLNKIVEGITPFLKAGQSGLDYGCGRTKLLGKLLRHQGFQMRSYDLFYHPEEEIFSHKYDFIILSEVIEHLRDPWTELTKLCRLLAPEGKLFVKTKLRPLLREDFTEWFYKRDLTHVQFFNDNSFGQVSFLLERGPYQKLGADLFLFTR